MRARGVIVVLLGCDGAGKTTLACTLVDGDPSGFRRIYMGQNVEAANVRLPFAGFLHERRTRSRNGPSPFRFGWKALGFTHRLLQAWTRFALARAHRLMGRTVVLDRYVYDSDLGSPSGTWDRLRRRLLRLSAPEPDLIVLLDAPADVLRARKPEHSLERLVRQRQDYLDRMRPEPRGVVVDATAPPSDVEGAVRSLIATARRFPGNYRPVAAEVVR